MNKHSKQIHYVLLGLAIAGTVVALYLTYSGMTNASFLCTEGGGCDQVRSSPYSKVMGVPVALIGLIGFLVICSVLLLEHRVSFFEANGPMITVGLTMIGTIYSLYLTYVEVFVIHAICPYCVASAIIMALLFILSLRRALQVITT